MEENSIERTMLTTPLNNEIKSDLICRWFYVMHPMDEDWEQLSIGFKTLEEAEKYFKTVNKEKYPYPRIMVELK